MNLKSFGYQRIYLFQVKDKFKQGLNIYALFYYQDFDSKKLIESPLYFLGKDKPTGLPELTDSYRNFLLETRENFNLKELPIKSTLEILIDHVLMKNVFPHSLIDTFFYTDNKRTVPKEFLKQIEEPQNHKQLTMF